jgi:hypothetical protein
MRDVDLLGDNQEWKPWDNVFIVPPEDFEKYAKNGLMGPIDATPLEPIYDTLGASRTFRSIIELSHAAHNMGLRDAAYAVTYDPKKDRNFATNPQMGAFENKTGRGEQWLWQGLDVAGQIGWLMESHNPDNWEQVHGHWDHALQTTDYIHKQAGIYRGVLENIYGSLATSVQAEIHSTTIEAVPATAVELDERVQQIRANTGLSYDAKEFKIQQEGARFWLLHSGAAAGHNEDYFDSSFYDEIVGEGLMKTFRENIDYYSRLNPERYTDREGMFTTIFEDTGFQDENALGVKPPPKVVGQMPKLSSDVANAILGAHHNWPLPRLGDTVEHMVQPDQAEVPVRLGSVVVSQPTSTQSKDV